MSMPLGKEAYNHTIFVYITIADSLGAFTTVETRVKVSYNLYFSQRFVLLCYCILDCDSSKPHWIVLSALTSWTFSLADGNF